MVNETVDKIAPTKKKFGMSGTQWGVIAGIIFAGIGSYFGTQLARGVFGSKSSIDDQLMEVANEINKSCPIMVDQDTRLDNTMAGVGKVFNYNYTLMSLDLEDIDVTEARNYMRPIVINAARTNKEMKYFRDNDVTLKYNYSDRAGNFVFDVIVTPADYR